MGRRTVQIVSIAFLLGCALPTETEDQFLDTIERSIEMPSGAKPLWQYSRSYFYIGGGRKVMGVLTTIRPPGRRWVAQNPGPFVSDGGCTIVTVTFDVRTSRVEDVQCNGVG
jgi:hypothetical protein